MSLLEKTMEDLGREYAKRVNSLRLAAGRIAEAEALAKTIAEKMGGTTYLPSATVCSHQHGGTTVRLISCGRHDEVRAALEQEGIAVQSESEREDSFYRTVRLHLAGFDVPVDLLYDRLVLKVAA